MKYMNKNDLPVEIKNNQLPVDETKSYKMYYDYKVRTSGGFVDAILLSAIMLTCFMWGMIIMLFVS